MCIEFIASLKIPQEFSQPSFLCIAFFYLSLRTLEEFFLHWFRLNMLSFMFRFMLSNICLRNKNQRSFLQLKCRFKFMFGFMFELYPKRDSLGLSKKPNVLPAKIQKMKMVASLINFSYYLTYIPLCGLYTKDI